MTAIRFKVEVIICLSVYCVPVPGMCCDYRTTVLLSVLWFVLDYVCDGMWDVGLTQQKSSVMGYGFWFNELIKTLNKCYSSLFHSRIRFFEHQPDNDQRPTD